MESSYITSAQKANQLPQFEEPEFAFVGRSNSGKSSLLNSLLGRKNLARASSTPGRTQMVNFFRVKPNKDQSIIFADLPGYGFNVAKKNIRQFWDELISMYLEREAIRAVLFLMDGRRTLEDFEITFLQDIASRHSLWIVMTRTDKMKSSEKQAQRSVLKKTLEQAGVPFDILACASSLTGQGIEDLKKELFHRAF